MKRRIFSILFALVLVLSFSLVMAVPVAAISYSVDAGDPATELDLRFSFIRYPALWSLH